MSIINDLSLEDYFNIRVKNLNCRPDTSIYIANTLQNYKNSVYEFQNKSLTLIFAEAKFNVSYKLFQDLADYILFMEATYSGALNGASQEYYWSLAQTSYYKCHILLNRTWPLMEEIADRFPDLIEQLNSTYNQDT